MASGRQFRWHQESQRHRSYCMPSWFRITGLEHNPHECFQLRGPGFEGTSPHNINNMMPYGRIAHVTARRRHFRPPARLARRRREHLGTDLGRSRNATFFKSEMSDEHIVDSWPSQPDPGIDRRQLSHTQAIHTMKTEADSGKYTRLATSGIQ